MAGRKKSESALDKLPPRKRKYVAARVEGQSKRQAALSAGFPVSMAENAAAKIETPDVHEAFRDLVRKAIPAERLIQRLSEGIDAMETEFAKFEGNISDSRETVAWSERREYLKLAAQFGGYVPKEQADIVVPVQVVIGEW